MKVVVFGGSGFLGSHVADCLTDNGFEVIIFDMVESLYLKDDQRMVIGDNVAHQEPLKTIEVNVLGNTNILDACKISKVKRFIFASSIYVYSDLASFYRSSKQACELIIEDYQKVFGLDYTILRYGSLYGIRANEFNFIYKIIKQVIEEGKIIRKGDGEEIRDYINVLDAARCSVEILTDEFRSQYVMITGTQSTKVKDLLIMIKEMFHGDIDIEYIPGENEIHYEITPYSFRPRVAKKFVSNYYYDLGQGILDIIYEVYSKSHKNLNNLEVIKDLIGRRDET
ncbi:MAG: NAD(P)-dependent oxidoreductase [Deltaproteobacteria bacterium]|nr:NAD(P)-dependent oxidoreductase [Deltaproteobacteria bacterium]